MTTNFHHLAAGLHKGQMNCQKCCLPVSPAMLWHFTKVLKENSWFRTCDGGTLVAQ